MVHVTMDLPERLAERVRPLGPWMPTVLELSFVGFRTQAAGVATDLIEFLSTNPSPRAVLEYHVSERAQARLQRLLALNEAGLLAEAEQRELDELERVEHIVVLLKVEVAAQTAVGP